MIRAVHVGGHLWGIHTPSFSPAVRDACKATPGMRWDGDRRIWVGYSDAVATAAGFILEKKLFLDSKTIPPPRPAYIPGRMVAEKGLRDYQKIGAEFLVANAESGVILADEMGLGKTVQTIRAARALKCRTLVVCPNIVRLVWEKEIKKWWPDCGPVVLPKGTKPLLGAVKSFGDTSTGEPATQVVIINYDILHAWVDPLLEWGAKFIVLDEAQYIKSEKSRRSVAARATANVTKYRAALTGTPMDNRPRDLWNIVDTISPGRFGNFFAYALRHCCPPDAPIWMADLSFKPLGKIVPGDKVIGWRQNTDGGRTRRRLTTSTVTHVQARTAAVVRITLASGRQIVCTPDHRWLSGRHSNKKFPYTRALVGHELAHVVDIPPPLDTSLARGYKFPKLVIGAKFKTPDRIVSIVPAGTSPVVSLTTTTGNYVVYGYASKNCDAHREEVVKNEKIVWVFNGKSNLEELNRRLQHFMLRRTKTDVRLEIPSKQRQVIDIEVPAKFRIAPDPEVIRSPKLLRRALAYAADGKLPIVIESIRDSIDNGHHVLAFTHRREVAEKIVNAIAAEGYTCGLFHGGTDIKKRQAIIDSKPQLLAATIDSANVGIDITYADVVDFVELTWEPNKLLQAESRSHRFGQQRPVLVRYHVAVGTADDLIASVVVAKLDVFETAIGKTNESLAGDLSGGSETAEDVLAEMCKSLNKAEAAKSATKSEKRARK